MTCAHLMFDVLHHVQHTTCKIIACNTMHLNHCFWVLMNHAMLDARWAKKTLIEVQNNQNSWFKNSISYCASVALTLLILFTLDLEHCLKSLVQIHMQYQKCKWKLQRRNKSHCMFDYTWLLQFWYLISQFSCNTSSAKFLHVACCAESSHPRFSKAHDAKLPIAAHNEKIANSKFSFCASCHTYFPFTFLFHFL